METKYLTVNDIDLAAAILKHGGLVAMPTETVYGLAANAYNGVAVAKIFKAKGRPMDNPLIVHISDIEQIREMVSIFPEKAQILAKHFWPGPLTIILPKSKRIPDEVSAGLPTVAVRFPAHPIAQTLISKSMPLAAPSANLSGKPSPTTAAHVWDDMNGRIDAVLDGGACKVGVESTVITLATDTPRLLRPGGITLEQLRAVIGEVVLDTAVLNPLKNGEAAASPGMKYKHYAPKAKVILLKGDEKAYCTYVNTHIENGTAALCYAEEQTILNVPTICLGADQDYEQQANNLFDALRLCDKKNFQKVYAHCPETTGMGLAVYNRIIRAAGFEVIDLEK